ncbi:hypothetical protein BKA70DRAFT_1370797 [Coprinopsis sp. MPI-PUGE-AT-0042]|nr:hypothetical protein BKA70DRAFT_1370797 [Coprinopsis sp. MPI-PUGE-AT-0042]
MAISPLPPFPEEIPTHPLLVIDYAKIERREPEEIDRLWEAATKLGFWYLSNHGCVEKADRIFDLGATAMALPMSEKLKYEQGDNGTSAGYKAAGANAVNAAGQPDIAEFFNLSKDDVLNYPNSPSGRRYPQPIEDAMGTVVQPFVQGCVDIHNTLFEVFNDRLGLPPGTLASMHTLDNLSGSETRITRTPPTGDVNRVAIGGHTDFGSLTILFNRLGGLQVLPPGSESWQYVKPLAGHAICNIGDALTIFSGQILRSNMHRVLPPPGSQALLERWSVVYFTRPGSNILLRPLAEESELIADAISAGQTAGEWFARRIKNQRMANRKGPETWEAKA